MNKRDEQFLELYHQYRYKDQLAYYEQRKKHFERAQNEFINISTVLMVLAALMGILSSIDWGFKLWCAVLAVILPTLSAALSTYNSLYAFERQAKIFQDAAHRLHEARVKSPYIQHLEQDSDYREAITEFVYEVELVFTEESGQWGLLANEIKGVEPPLPEA